MFFRYVDVIWRPFRRGPGGGEESRPLHYATDRHRQ